MFVVVDDFFIKALRKNGYNLDYDKMRLIIEEALTERNNRIDQINCRLLKQINDRKK